MSKTTELLIFFLMAVLVVLAYWAGRSKDSADFARERLRLERARQEFQAEALRTVQEIQRIHEEAVALIIGLRASDQSKAIEVVRR